MEKIKTATGKEFPCDYFNPFPPAGQVNLRVLSTPLAAAVAVFSDPKETTRLWFGEQYLAHHTRLVAIVPETDAVRVILAKE